MSYEVHTMQGTLYALPREQEPSESERYIWDFGAFTLVGTQDCPQRQVFDIDLYKLIVNEHDVNWRRETEAESTVSLEFYTYEYETYVETEELEDATAIVYGESVWMVDYVEEYNGEELYFVVRADSPQSESLAFEQSELENMLEEGEAAPLLALQ